MKNIISGAYLSKGTIGNVGMSGSPIATFRLVGVPLQNSVTGTVVITQTVNGPDNTILIQVKGKITTRGIGKFTKVVSLSGQYLQVLSSPEDGSFLADFNAYFAVDDDWNGTGGFSYYQHKLENVPVENVKNLKEELV